MFWGKLFLGNLNVFPLAISLCVLYNWECSLGAHNYKSSLFWKFPTLTTGLFLHSSYRSRYVCQAGAWVDLDWSIWEIASPNSSVPCWWVNPSLGLAFDSRKATEGKDTDLAPLGAYGQLRDESPLSCTFQKTGQWFFDTQIAWNWRNHPNWWQIQ